MITAETVPVVKKLLTPGVVARVLDIDEDDFTRRVGEGFARSLSATPHIASAGFLLKWELFLYDAQAGRIPALAGYPQGIYAVLHNPHIVRELAKAVCDPEFAAAVCADADERDAMIAQR